MCCLLPYLRASPLGMVSVVEIGKLRRESLKLRGASSSRTRVQQMTPIKSLAQFEKSIQQIYLFMIGFEMFHGNCHA